MPVDNSFDGRWGRSRVVLHVAKHTVKVTVSTGNNMNRSDGVIRVVVELKYQFRNHE